MSIEQHVVSLELAKQLNEAGWKKETQFVWAKSLHTEGYFLLDRKTAEDIVEPFVFSACLATEILEELPIDINGRLLTIVEGNGIYDVDYGINWHGQQDKFLPNALAKMYLYLKKEGLIK